MNHRFISEEPKLEDYWRGIVLFGRNVASYKFSLAKTLLELNPSGGDFLSLETLAEPFSRHISQHLKENDKQATSSSSRFLDACRDFNAGVKSHDELIAKTISLGFNNVIDAFHVVGQGEIPKRFFLDERSGVAAKGIRVTDEFSWLAESEQAANLPSEVEARWRLVETSWQMGVARNLLRIDYDESKDALFAIDRKLRRTSVTSSRDALNGYQKGKCFYCFGTIRLKDKNLAPDVDHFFPHVLKSFGFGDLVDGIWNLVLSCRNCNRGPGGKFQCIPTERLLSRLHHRNEFLISSHHPLRDTLMQQTGRTANQRRSFLRTWHENAWSTTLCKWEPHEVAEAVF